jgi:glycerophosphoryl diester phosphodiesterase
MEIWAHRGAYHFAPENTLAAFQLAVDMGADGIELDIQLSRDNEIVVIHDETLERTSDGFGYVKDHTLAELKKLNFNKRGISQPAFMEIPTLAEVFELLKPTPLRINIEFKTGILFYEGIEEKAQNLAVEYGLMHRIVWSSFNYYSVQKLKRLQNDAETALLCGDQLFVTGEICEKTGVAALHPHFIQLRYPGLVEECHSRGVKVRSWTINEPEEFRLASDLGIDGLITNSSWADNLDTFNKLLYSGDKTRSGGQVQL